MERLFRFGEWQVNGYACTLCRDGQTQPIQVEPRAMDVLSALCNHAGAILSADDLLRLCWDGLAVGENQVHKAIAQLRRAFNDDANQPRYIENIRKRGYRTVAQVTLLSGPSTAPTIGSWANGSPFLGLDPFDADHAELFFGRDAAIARLKELVAQQVRAGQALILVLGPSGSGKTSLIQAGLLPALRQAPAPQTMIASAILDLGDVGDLPLLTALGGALLDLEVEDTPLLSGHSAEGIGSSLAGSAEVLQQNLALDRGGRCVLFIDRLEALFNPSQVEFQQKTMFLQALDQISRSDAIIVVAACRNDFYPDLAQEPLLMQSKAAGGHFDLTPPSRAEISQMIRLPAQAAGLSFGLDPDSKMSLADQLCEDAAASPDSLPLLQYTLQELYRLRSPSRELTFAAYRSLGGIEGAIGKRAEDSLSPLPERVQAALFSILPLVVSIGGDNGLVQSHRAPWTALTSAEERTLLDTLVEQRLFVSLNYEGQSVFGVAHEALLRRWPRVVDWIAEHRQALRSRSRLESQAEQWLSEGKRRDLLLPRGKLLAEAVELARRPQFQMSAAARELVRASQWRSRQGDYLRAGLLASFSAIAIAAVILGIRARQAEAVATQRRLEADDLMSYMVGDFVDKLRPLGRLDLLDGAAQKALGYMRGEDISRLPIAARLQQARALQTLAEVSRSRGNPTAGLQALEQAERLLQANLAEQPNDLELLRTSGAVVFWFGQIARDQGREEEAARRFNQYRDFAERMNKIAPDDSRSWNMLASALECLGSVNQLRGDDAKAAEEFDAAIALRRRAVEADPANKAKQRDLANVLSFLADCKSALGDLKAAEDLHIQMRTLLVALHQAEPNTLQWSRTLYLADLKHGRLLAAEGKYSQAIDLTKKALELAEYNYKSQPENFIWHKDLLDIKIQIIFMTYNQNNSDDLIVEIDKAITEYDELMKKNPNEDNIKRSVAYAYYVKALCQLKLNDIGQSELTATKSEDIIRNSKVNKFSKILISQINILRSSINIGEKSIQYCLSSIDNLSSLAKYSKNYAILDPWVKSNICYGRTTEVLSDIEYLESIGYKEREYVNFLNQKRR